MLGGADNPNGELLSYIIGADRTGVFIKRKRFNLPWSGQVENMSVEGLFVHGGDLWQLKYHHHAFSHHNKGSPI